MNNIESLFDIYIGSPIVHESDRITLKKVIETIKACHLSAIVMANINISGRQIDLVVATEKMVLVIEAKKSGRPLRGGENGIWEFLAATGGWRKTGRNYYIQALDAKNSLHAAMSKFSGKIENYPDAALVFVTGIPQGSELPAGDFKVKIGDLRLLEGLESKSSSSWSLDQWHSFAKQHRLIKVEGVDVAFDEKLIHATLLLDQYRTSFSEYYLNQIQGFVPLICRVDQSTLESVDIAGRLTAQKGLLIVGPSGCGKTMLAQQLGLFHADNGGIPIFIEAKNFEKEFSALVGQEAALLAPSSSINALFSACRIFDSSLLIILDGYNECAPSLRKRLARCLRAAAIRYRANIIVSSQEVSEITQLDLGAVHVPEPSAELKKSIADMAAEESISPRVEELLSLAKNSLEARIIGQISKSIEPGVSRYALFDTFIRKRMDGVAQEAIRILTHIGKYFSDNLSFSMTIREFDRLREAHAWQPVVSEHLVAVNVIKRRSDRLSFGHELYFNAFLAESVVRTCGGDSDRLVAAISAPKNLNSRILILGAIDNTNLLDAVLQKIEDVEVINACVLGECGAYARVWADNLCKDVLNKIEKEASSIEFVIGDEAWMKISAKSSSFVAWSSQDKAVVDSICHLLSKGQYLDKIYSIAGVVDERTHEVFPRLIEEAKLKKVPLRSSLFGAAFADQNSDISITRIIARVSINFSTDREKYADKISRWVNSNISSRDMSNGQFFFILHLCRLLYVDSPLIKVLPEIIEDRWNNAPYHLRIDILDAAQRLWGCDPADKERLAEVISALKTDNVMVSSSIIDALKSLGAIDDPGYGEIVRAEIEEVLREPENPENWTMARNIYDRQFDHPYDDVYGEFIRDLPELQRKKFLCMAVRAKDNFCMFASFMINDLADFGDPATGKYIEHWTELPPEDSPIPQDAVGVFVGSHVILARLQHPLLPKNYDDVDEKNAMAACGEIYYWSSREDLNWADRVKRCQPAWEVLLKHELGVSLAALRECESVVRENLNRLTFREPDKVLLADRFPDYVADISRQSLSGKFPQRLKRPWMKEEELLGFAVNVLGHYGEATDLILLRSLVDHPYLGSIAIKAIRSLEDIPARVSH